MSAAGGGVVGATSPGARRYIAEIASWARQTDRPLCLDSGSLIDYFAGNEPIASLIDPLLQNPDVPVVVSTVTSAELVTRPAMQGDHARVWTIRSALLALPRLVLVDVNEPHAIAVAQVRADTGLKLPDAAVVATARLATALALIGNDRQWRHKPLSLAKSDGLPSLLARVVEAMTP